MASTENPTNQEESIPSQPTVSTIRSEETLLFLLDSIPDLPIKPPSFYLDLEGPQGKPAFLCLFIPPKNTIFRIPIGGDRGVDFTKANASGSSLKSILETELIPKVAFDVRVLSRVLFQQLDIRIDGMRDIQLMELASRDSKQSRKFVAGLRKCAEEDLPASNEVRRRWLEPESVDLYRFTNTRGHVPRSSMRRVETFPALWAVYYRRLRRPQQAFWFAQSKWETKNRVAEAQLKGFDSNSKGNALGPEVWYDHEQRAYAMEMWKKDGGMGISLGG
ncbi:hypothetical protein M426DRAFT_323512 [Hypoxylon sp. CI-4A]|nr:hypothetical protein M426DRAFT_323512 [Hypoxylon sp. CI-4A]